VLRFVKQPQRLRHERQRYRRVGDEALHDLTLLRKAILKERGESTAEAKARTVGVVSETSVHAKRLANFSYAFGILAARNAPISSMAVEAAGMVVPST
jgi:hypothetical protein